MPELSFLVEGAQPHRSAVVPELVFRLALAETSGTPIQSIALRCQVRIQPARRRYDESEQEKLLDLFGTPDRWGKTVRDMLWTSATVTVPPFVDETMVDLPVPCGYDFVQAATKYFDALSDGEVPLSFLFSGTIFYETDNGNLQVAQVPWEKEARYRLPVAVWQELMQRYYPNTAWLHLRKDVFNRLHRYKSQRGLPSWEQAIEELLLMAKEPV